MEYRKTTPATITAWRSFCKKLQVTVGVGPRNTLVKLSIVCDEDLSVVVQPEIHLRGGSFPSTGVYVRMFAQSTVTPVMH